MSEQMPLAEVWRRVLEANIRYYTVLGELAASLVKSVFSAVAEFGPEITATDALSRSNGGVPVPVPVSPRPPSPATMVLEGQTGSRATGFFLVENKLPKELSARVEVSPLIDPEGRQIRSALRFEPGIITLAAGQQVLVRVTAEMNRALAAGVRYTGEISVPGMAGARIPIVVRRRPVTRRTASARGLSASGPTFKSHRHGKPLPRRSPAPRKAHGGKTLTPDRRKTATT
jgi:hypothetical protein